jgi:hypothetical protein
MILYKKYSDGIVIPWIKNKKWHPYGLSFRLRRTKDRGIGIWTKNEEVSIEGDSMNASFLIYVNFSLWWTWKVEISPANG